MTKVKIYSTPTCIYCKLAKDFFNKNNIQYEDINVAEDKKAREEMVKKTQQMGVPVIEIGDQYVVGFDQRKIEDLLGLK